MNNGIDWFCPYLTQIKLPIEFLVELAHDSTVQNCCFCVGDEKQRERNGERETYILSPRTMYKPSTTCSTPASDEYTLS